MTIDIESTAQYYKDLLIIQYENKEKARAEVGLHITTLLANDIISKVQDGYDIDTAIGTQLDVLGRYIGKDRLLEATELSDENYRFILKLRVLQNNIDYSHKSIDDGLFAFFGDSLIMSAGTNMTITYFVDSANLNKASIAFSKGVLPRPMGVSITGLIERNKKLFGFTNYNRSSVSDLLTGFTNYTDGFTKSGESLNYDKVINF